jgi:cytoskeletal protein CcmA (bactofilin family)
MGATRRPHFPTSLWAGARLLALCGCITSASAQGATDWGEDNVYIAGASVRIEQVVRGDLVAGGGQVSIEREVKGDATVGAGDVRMAASIDGDLRAAGGNIYIAGPVRGEVIGAGGNINLAPGAQISGRVWLAAGNVRVEGTSRSDITIYARNIAIGGDIGGSARLVGEQIEILPHARIQGRVSYRSPNAIRTDATATIAGGVSHEPVVPMHTMSRAWHTVAWIFGAIWGIGVFALGALLILLLPQASQSVERTLAQSPGQCLGWGLVLLVAIPLLAAMLFVTLVGIPLAAAVLALYPVLLLFGYLAAMLFVGNRGAALVRKKTDLSIATRVVALALTLIAFALIRAVPFVGTLVNGLALLFGLGALALTLYRHFSTPDHPLAAPSQQQPPPALTGSAV